MNNNEQLLTIHTDGSSRGNPGRSGYGVVLTFPNGNIHEFGGFEPHATGNQMELTAAIAALTLLESWNYQKPVILFTDSEHVKNGITQWIGRWKRRSWKTSQGKKIENQPLWTELDRLNRALTVEWRHVRGHSGDPQNERCDFIARAFSGLNTPSLQSDLTRAKGSDKKLHPVLVCQ